MQAQVVFHNFCFIGRRRSLKALGLAFFLEFIAPPADTFFGDDILCGNVVNCPSFFQTAADNFLFKFGGVILRHNKSFFSF